MDITSLFLGPKSENNETFKRFFDVIVEDILNFRNNYHPDDPPLISERHKLSDAYVNTRADFMQELRAMLSKLRAHSIPAWDTSYIAHMNSDLLYPAIAGYISTIMYNPNNVTGEVSSVSTQWEINFIGHLCSMVGYPSFSALAAKGSCGEDHSWGHLTSGGTVANIEGLWVARNLKYMPLALKLAIDMDPENFGFLDEVRVPYFEDQKVCVGDLDYQAMFNLSPELTYSLLNSLSRAYGKHKPDSQPLLKAIKEYSLQYQGLQGIHDLVRKQSGAELPYPVLLIAQTRHYCWEKSMEVLGLGINQLKPIEADRNYKLDIAMLDQFFQDHPDTPVLAVVPIIGTTEEGVLDPMHDLLALREKTEKARRSFYIHADAAYGGYYASLFVAPDGSRHAVPEEAVRDFKAMTSRDGAGNYVTEEGFVIKHDELEAVNKSLSEIFAPLSALQHADSITIDPHKLGYIPYPAGTVLFKNHQAKDLISFEAPYLKWSGDTQPGTERIFLGQATLEGSRPGAAAAACYLATRIVPLNITGHGKMMLHNMIAAKKFFNTIPDEKPDQCKVVPQYYPDTNVVCYSIGYPGVVEEPKYMNLLANKVFDNMTKKTSKLTSSYEYFISKTSIHYGHYKAQIDSMLKDAGIPEKNYGLAARADDGDFFILRSVLMNPLALGLPDDYYSGFWQKVSEIAEDALEDILDDLIKTKFGNKRVPVLWVENRDSVEKIKDAIELSGLGRYFSFSFLSDNESICDFMYRAGDSQRTGHADSRLVITDLCLDGAYEDKVDVSKLFPLIRKGVNKGQQIICYSKYVADDHAGAADTRQAILDEATGQGQEAGKAAQVHFVGKASSFENIEAYPEGSRMVHAFNREKRWLVKKMILALQRVGPA